jgi:hypothetical protein
MCLFHLRVQIDRRCQMLIQKLDGLSTNVLGECVVCREHQQISKWDIDKRQIRHDGTSRHLMAPRQPIGVRPGLCELHKPYPM